MALPADYISGTITLTNGSPSFTGTGTGWQAADFREGDILLGIEDHAGEVYVIESITGQAAGTLTQPWAGTSGTYTYRMRYEWDSSRVSAQARAMVELLGNGNLEALASLTGPGVPVFNGPHSMEVRAVEDFINGVAYDVQVDTLADRDAYDGQAAGFSVLVSDVGDGRSAVYSKASNTSGDWTDPAYITGPVGPNADVTVGTTTTLPPGSDATVVGIPTVGGVELDFGIPSGEGFAFIPGGYNPATTYAKGDVVRDNNSSWIALQATTGNTPPVLPTTSNAYWELLAAAGVNGTGTGDVVGPTSSTSGSFVGFDGTTGKLVRELTNTEATARINTFTTLKGLTPGATSGDAAAGRLLAANGAWVDPPESANYDGDIAALALSLSGIQNSRVALGNGVADAFGDSTGVDASASVNEVYDGVNDLYRPEEVAAVPILRTLGTPFGNFTANGGLAAIFDGITNQATSAAAAAISVTTGYAGRSHSSAVSRVETYGSNNAGYDANSGAQVITLNLFGKVGSAPISDTDGVLLGTISFTEVTNESSPRTITSNDPTTVFDHRWVQMVTNGASTNLFFGELVFYGPISYLNMSLVSVNYPVSAQQTSSRLLLQTVSTAAIVAGTDIDAQVSRDGGTTWSNTPLTLSSTLGNVRTYESGSVSVAAQPSGTNMKWRARTLTTKNISFSGVVQQWRT